MSDTHTYVTRNGLKCVYTRRRGFTEQYAGLGIHFGNAHQEYLVDGIYHKSRGGVAHFLEHKAFAMPDGTDALELFDSMNAQANAYTSREQTIYYFETSDDLFAPLGLLLQMVFTKGYTKKNIQSEKEIILSELMEEKDNPDGRIYEKMLKSVYPHSAYSKEVLGTKTDILSMCEADLDQAFYTFYTPDNALLSVVADVEPEDLFSFIEKQTQTLSFSVHEVCRLPFLGNHSPVKRKILYEDVPSAELHVLGILPGFTYKDSMITNRFIALFSNITSIESEFFKTASGKGLLVDEDISVMVSSSEFGMYFQFDVCTTNPGILSKMFLKKLKNFTQADLTEHITMQAVRDYVSEHIRALDSVAYIGDETLTLGLEGADYAEECSKIRSLEYADICKLTETVRQAPLSFLMVYPKNQKRNK